MGKSYRKTPVMGVTGASSEKWDKKNYNRKFRRQTRNFLREIEDNAVRDESLYTDKIYPPKSLNEVSEPFNFAKDGKTYIGEWKDSDDEDLQNTYKKAIRK